MVDLQEVISSDTDVLLMANILSHLSISLRYIFAGYFSFFTFYCFGNNH